MEALAQSAAVDVAYCVAIECADRGGSGRGDWQARFVSILPGVRYRPSVGRPFSVSLDPAGGSERIAYLADGVGASATESLSSLEGPART